MTRATQPAVLRRKLERVQALLDAETEAHKLTFEHMRKMLYENVDMQLKLERIQAALAGEDADDPR